MENHEEHAHSAYSSSINSNQKELMRQALLQQINNLTQIYNDDFLFIQGYTNYKRQMGYISQEGYRKFLVDQIFRLNTRLNDLRGGNIKRVGKKRTVKKSKK